MYAHFLRFLIVILFKVWVKPGKTRSVKGKKEGNGKKESKKTKQEKKIKKETVRPFSRMGF